MAVRADAAERALVVAQQLRAAAEETRRILSISRDLVARSRQQALGIAAPGRSLPTVCAKDRVPSRELVEGLVRVYELAEDDGEARTCALLGNVLVHVGHRIAAVTPHLVKMNLH